ncbi:phage tail tape measure C-terminal domain-containing protein [Methyloligella halotolerans]|uniref:phage tail tape measure C-terminal domain-containing protein n=1 Tax=Methyloligella halotolerans TaxID=1177755 RepID=UPI001470CFA3|nr:phage tail tape measure C-terminal domain-containing protein [Methyloligella halotolerans]
MAASAGLIKLASDATESENLFAVAMGDMADRARDFSEQLGKAVGLNPYETRKTIATFFQMTTAMGISRAAAFDMSKGLAQLTGDLASFFNLSPDDAFQKLQSGISGEIEPLRRLGVSVSETNVKMTLMRMGLIQGNEKLTEQQKILGRYITILDQTSNAQGDLARTLDSPANMMRVLGSKFEEAATKLGNTLLPIFQRFMAEVGGPALGALQLLVDRFSALDPSIQNVVIAMAALAAATGPLLFVFGGFFRVVSSVIGPLTALTKLIAAGKVLDALTIFRSKWALIAAAVLGAAAGVAYFSGVWDDFKKKIEGLNIFAGLGDDAGAFAKILNDEAVKAFKDLSSGAGGAAEAAAALKRQMDEGRQVFEQTRTPVEQLRMEFERLQGLLNAGAIDWDTYTRAIGQAQDQFDELSRRSSEAFQQIEEATQAVTDGMDRAFSDFVENGKVNFKELAGSILQDLARITFAQTVTGPLGGALSSGLGGLFGFAKGGSFKVGGSGGTDSQLVAFRASPNERVSVTTPQQEAARGVGGVTIHSSIDARGSDMTESRFRQILDERDRDLGRKVVTIMKESRSRRIG